MSFRGLNVGRDTISYYNIFRQISNHDLTDIIEGKVATLEIPYQLLMKLTDTVGLNYFYFQILISSLYCFLVGYIFYKYSPNPILSTVVFLGGGLYLAAFNITRQMVATCFVFLFFVNILNSKYRNAIIFAIIGYGFHKTVILPVIFISLLYLIKNSRKILYVLPFVVIGLYYILDIGFQFVNYIWADTYANYLDNHKDIQTAGLSQIVWLIDVLIAAFVIYNNRSTFAKLSAILSLFFVLFNVIGLQFNYAERIGYYFALLTCITFAFIDRQLSNPVTRLIYNVGVIICFLAFFYISTLTKQYSDYILFFDQV